LGGRLGVLEELDGDDEGSEDDELGADRIDVKLLLLLLQPKLQEERRCWREGMAFVGGGSAGAAERAGQTPLARKLGIEAVEDADGEGDGLER
jgi:hypothetical protein